MAKLVVYRPKLGWQIVIVSIITMIFSIAANDWTSFWMMGGVGMVELAKTILLSKEVPDKNPDESE